MYSVLVVRDSAKLRTNRMQNALSSLQVVYSQHSVQKGCCKILFLTGMKSKISIADVVLLFISEEENSSGTYGLRTVRGQIHTFSISRSMNDSERQAPKVQPAQCGHGDNGTKVAATAVKVAADNINNLNQPDSGGLSESQTDLLADEACHEEPPVDSPPAD